MMALTDVLLGIFILCSSFALVTLGMAALRGLEKPADEDKKDL